MIFMSSSFVISEVNTEITSLAVIGLVPQDVHWEKKAKMVNLS